MDRVSFYIYQQFLCIFYKYNSYEQIGNIGSSRDFSSNRSLYGAQKKLKQIFDCYEASDRKQPIFDKSTIFISNTVWWLFPSFLG